MGVGIAQAFKPCVTQQPVHTLSSEIAKIEILSSKALHKKQHSVDTKCITLSANNSCVEFQGQVSDNK